jgi:hypothetical protein
MWVCKKCGEENEDNFDTCYKCLNFSEEGASKSVDYQKKLEKENQKVKKEKPKKKKGNIFISLLFAIITFYCVRYISSVFEEPVGNYSFTLGVLIMCTPAILSFLVFNFIRNNFGEESGIKENQIITKKLDDEIRIRVKSTGEIKNIKKTNWKKIINIKETHFYDVVYDTPNDNKKETTDSSKQKNNKNK